MGRYDLPQRPEGGEIWGDMGRYDLPQRPEGGAGQPPLLTSRRMREQAGRYGEIWGDMGRYDLVDACVNRRGDSRTGRVQAPGPSSDARESVAEQGRRGQHGGFPGLLARWRGWNKGPEGDSPLDPWDRGRQ